MAALRASAQPHANVNYLAAKPLSRHPLQTTNVSRDDTGQRRRSEICRVSRDILGLVNRQQ